MAKMREVWKVLKLLDTDEEMGLKDHEPQAVFLSMPCECIKSSQVKPGLSLELQLQRQQWTEPVETTLPSQTPPATALGGCFCVEGTELKCAFALDMCIKGQFLCLYAKH